MRIADDQRNAFDRGQFLRGALRVASGDQNARVRVIAVHTAHGLAHLIVGGRGDGAGVEDDQIRIRGGSGGGKTFRGQAGFNGGTVGLGGSTAEVFYEEAVHCIYVNWSGDARLCWSSQVQMLAADERR